MYTLCMDSHCSYQIYKFFPLLAKKTFTVKRKDLHVVQPLSSELKTQIAIVFAFFSQRKNIYIIIPCSIGVFITAENFYKYMNNLIGYIFIHVRNFLFAYFKCFLHAIYCFKFFKLLTFIFEVF